MRRRRKRNGFADCVITDFLTRVISTLISFTLTVLNNIDVKSARETLLKNNHSQDILKYARDNLKSKL